ncbi:MAG TPA: GyrI-like domain-containing protein [Candidatus Acidoferrales bacterium]|nr:GyrI-like domain-containing protein [Candidatus Acidoferrales bacterium]
MDKIDFKKELKHLYDSSDKQVTIIDVPDMNFLMVDGQGAPASPQYQEAIEALYAVAYALKFNIKKAQGIDYGVMPLEGLWWADDMTKFLEDKNKWRWDMMIMQPKYVTKELFKEAVEQVREKKAPAALDKVRFECYHEGKAAQIMHVGPFSAEGPNVEKIHAAIKAAGHELSGKHHEIYLSDARKAAPEKWKTILRQPMK